MFYSVSHIHSDISRKSVVSTESPHCTWYPRYIAHRSLLPFSSVVVTTLGGNILQRSVFCTCNACCDKISACCVWSGWSQKLCQVIPYTGTLQHGFEPAIVLSSAQHHLCQMPGLMQNGSARLLGQVGCTSARSGNVGS